MGVTRRDASGSCPNALLAWQEIGSEAALKLMDRVEFPEFFGGSSSVEVLRGFFSGASSVEFCGGVDGRGCGSPVDRTRISRLFCLGIQVAVPLVSWYIPGIAEGDFVSRFRMKTPLDRH